MKRIIIAAMTFFGSLAFAGSGSGNVVMLLPHIGNLLFVHVDGPVSGAPACASQTTGGKRYVIPSADKTIAATAMLAFSMGKAINISGSGDCGVWGDTETLRYLTISK